MVRSAKSLIPSRARFDSSTSIIHSGGSPNRPPGMVPRHDRHPGGVVVAQLSIRQGFTRFQRGIFRTGCEKFPARHRHQ